MSDEMVREVAENSGSTGSARLLLTYFAIYSQNGSRIIEASPKFFMSVTNLLKTQYYSNLKTLLDIGELEKTDTKGKFGHPVFRFSGQWKSKQEFRETGRILRKTGNSDSGKPDSEIPENRKKLSGKPDLTYIPKDKELEIETPYIPQNETTPLVEHVADALFFSHEENNHTLPEAKQVNIVDDIYQKEFGAFFDKFWKLYPKNRKEDKPRCKQRLYNITKGDPGKMSEVLNGLQRWVESHEWRTVEHTKYLPLVGTWINKQRWETEPTPYDPKKDPANRNKVYTNADAGWETPKDPDENDGW